MLIDGADPFATAKPNVRLIRARRFNATLVGSDGITGKNPKAFPPFPLPSSEGSALVMMRTGNVAALRGSSPGPAPRHCCSSPYSRRRWRWRSITARFNETKCFTQYERTFLVPMFE